MRVSNEFFSIMPLPQEHTFTCFCGYEFTAPLSLEAIRMFDQHFIDEHPDWCAKYQDGVWRAYGEGFVGKV